MSSRSSLTGRSGLPRSTRSCAGLASEYGAIVVDMWDHPVNARDNLLSEDRIHFSTSGQAVMAAEMVKKLASSLARMPEGKDYQS